MAKLRLAQGRQSRPMDAAGSARTTRMVKTDLGLILVVLALVVIGLVMVYSASYGFALLEGGVFQGRPTYFVRRQVLFAVAGLALLGVLTHVDYHVFTRQAVRILLATIGVLILTFFVGKTVGGATRWIFQGSVQPSEMARVGAVLYIAVWLASRGEALRAIDVGLIPFALLLGFIAGLIVLQPDFSTAILLVATATAMFFVAGADMKQLLLGFLVGGVAVAVVGVAAPYRSSRVDLWLASPFSDPLDRGFQVIQSLAALNKGELVGIGLGQSQQKFAIYAPHTDGIFAVIGEELGFVGTSLVIGLYALWAWRGMRIAWHAPDAYGTLLAVGIVSWVVFQAILHIAVITASVPFTGTVLPFVSYGGSSLVATLASTGILLNISRRGQRTGLSLSPRGSQGQPSYGLGGAAEGQGAP
jgi:cell division protein FtsW